MDPFMVYCAGRMRYEDLPAKPERSSDEQTKSGLPIIATRRRWLSRSPVLRAVVGHTFTKGNTTQPSSPGPGGYVGVPVQAGRGAQ
jgi:hypothetical protein